MNDQNPPAGKTQAKPNPVKGLALAVFSIALVLVFMALVPGKKDAIASGSISFLKEVALILPAICILMGLFGVFVSRELVIKILGKSAGWKGAFIAIGLGSLPTGPLYAAFPMAAVLLEKGARPANIFLFLTAWACIKLPQLLLELRFLGPRFMLARLALTIAMAVPTAFLIERYLERGSSAQGPRITQ
jgi:uncharacterized membrane protein YraQ (UPF0718 family)